MTSSPPDEIRIPRHTTITCISRMYQFMYTTLKKKGDIPNSSRSEMNTISSPPDEIKIPRHIIACL